MIPEFYFTPELHLRDGRIIRDLGDAAGFAREQEARLGVDQRDEVLHGIERRPRSRLTRQPISSFAGLRSLMQSDSRLAEAGQFLPTKRHFHAGPTALAFRAEQCAATGPWSLPSERASSRINLACAPVAR